MSPDVGPYRLDGLLGRGGMGEVHRAWDTRRRRWVALKLLDAGTGADPDYRRRFRREAEVAARLSDPHVVPVHDYGEIDGRLFLDMRLVEGRDLAAVLRDGPLGTARTLALLTQVAAALDAAHAAGLVHRDVKPSNVLIGAGDFAYVADFGLVHDRGDAATSRAEGVLGTLEYMPPERLRGDPVDARADVYALACVLVECLTGARPFPTTDAAELVAAHLYRDPPRVTDRDPDLPARLDDVVARGLAKDPADRYPAAGALIADAVSAVAVVDPDAVPADVVPAPRTPTPPRGGTRVAARPTRVGPPEDVAPRRRRRWVVITVAAVAVVLVVVIGTVAVRRYVGDGFAVGLSPVAVVFSADGVQALVVNAGARSVSVLDTRRRAVVRRIPVDGRAVGAVGVGADRVAVTTVDGTVPQAVAVLDLASDTVTASLPLPLPGAGAPVADRDGTRVAVPGRTAVAVLDLGRGVVDATVPRGSGPLAMTADGRRLAVATDAPDGSGEIDVLDLVGGADRTTLPTAGPVDALVAGPSGGVVHAAVGGPAPGLVTVDVSRAGSGRSSVPLPAPARALAVTPDGRVVVAVDTARPRVVVVAPRRAGDAGRVGDVGALDEFTGPVALSVTPDGSEVWVANTDLGTVTVLPLRP